jgi:hypothetical protein
MSEDVRNRRLAASWEAVMATAYGTLEHSEALQTYKAMKNRYARQAVR